MRRSLSWRWPAAALLCPLLCPPVLASEEDTQAGHDKMVELLAQVARDALAHDPFIGEGDAPRLRRELAALTGKRRLRFGILRDLGFHELRLGNNDAAIQALTQANAIGPKVPRVTPDDLKRVRFDLALAWLRQAETQNCVARHTAQSCLVPIGPEGVHTDQEPARKALDALGQLLEDMPGDPTARWLYNVAAMTVGEYPDAVPEDIRIPPERFASEVDFPRFVDVAGEHGLATFSLSGGTVVDDFDGDGDLDLVNSTWNPAGQLRLFIRTPDGYEDATERAGLTGILGGLNVVHADYDGDGDLDLLVLRGAWLGEAGRIPNSLLANQGDGTFRDVTFAAGLGKVHLPTQTAAFADYDGDGDLDLYVGNEGGSPDFQAPCQLFRNNGDGTFRDVADSAGVRNDRFAKGVTWGDIDGDGDPDLYVANSNGRNRLYRNNGDGSFTDIAKAAGVEEPIASFPTWFWDYDNDGALDLYVASYLPQLDHVARDLCGLPPGAESGKLYRGDGDGGFTDVTQATGFDRTAVVMGANFGDLDNDGFLDVYLGTGYPGYEALMPNKMFKNTAGEGGRRFADVTTAGGFGHIQKGHGVAFADLDDDGDQDVFIEMGGAFPGDKFRNAYFRNPGFGNHFTNVRLVGVQSNRFGIGARIRCEIEEGGEVRSIYRHVSSGGSFGASPLRIMIGLGQAESIRTLEVTWPTSGVVQTFSDVEVGRRITIREDAQAPTYE